MELFLRRTTQILIEQGTGGGKDQQSRARLPGSEAAVFVAGGNTDRYFIKVLGAGFYEVCMSAEAGAGPPVSTRARCGVGMASECRGGGLCSEHSNHLQRRARRQAEGRRQLWVVET